METENQTKRRPKRYLWKVLLFVVVLCLVWAGFVGFHSFKLLQERDQIKTVLSEGGMEDGIGQSEIIISDASLHLNQLEMALRPCYGVMKVFSFIPGIGNTLNQVEPAIKYLSQLAQSGDLLIGIVAPVYTEIKNDENANLVSLTVNALDEQSDQVEKAGDAIQEALYWRQQLDLSGIPLRFQDDFEMIDRYLPLLEQGSELLRVLPDLSGVDQPRTYLMMAQNHDELRGGGGFITGLGSLTVDQGKVSSFQIDDSYAVDDFSKQYPAPPAPLKEFMLADYWVTRDGNWSPDFSYSASQVQDLFELSTGVKTDGVIAFDQEAVIQVLKAMGPVVLAEQSAIVDASNVEQYIQDSWAPASGQSMDEEWWKNRKDFMGLLGREIIKQALSIRNPNQILALSDTVLECMRSGHLLVYSDHPEIASLLMKHGLDGDIHPTEGDFLMLVDSNVGFNKVDSKIQRSMKYAVDLTDFTQPSGNLTVSYTNTNNQLQECRHEATYSDDGKYSGLQNRCYWDYWRVLVPPGNDLQSAIVAPVAAENLISGKAWNAEVAISAAEAGLNACSGLILVPTASTKTFQLKWLINPAAVRFENARLVYSLRVQKQLGLAELPFTLEITAPAGYVPELNEGAPWKNSSGTSEWVVEDVLKGSQDYILSFIPAR